MTYRDNAKPEEPEKKYFLKCVIHCEPAPAVNLTQELSSSLKDANAIIKAAESFLKNMFAHKQYLIGSFIVNTSQIIWIESSILSGYVGGQLFVDEECNQAWKDKFARTVIHSDGGVS